MIVPILPIAFLCRLKANSLLLCFYDTITVNMTDREHAVVLAALRFYAAAIGAIENRCGYPLVSDVDDIATNGNIYPQSKMEQIDWLAEALNGNGDGIPDDLTLEAVVA